MPASQSTTGFGTEIGILVSGTYQYFAEVKSISGLGESRDMREVTHLKSPTRYREKKPGLRDGKGATFTIAYVPGGADETLALTALSSELVEKYAVKFPDGRQWLFDGFATDLEVGELNAEGEMEATVVITQSGATARPALNPTLAALSLSSSGFSAGAAAGTVIGAIQGATSGSTIDVFPADGRVAISGGNLVVGSSAASAGTFSITLRETLAGATNTPRTTTINVTVAAAAPTLSALTLSASQFTAGAAAGTVIGAIQGATSGSAIDVFPTDARVAISGGNLVVGSTAASVGTINVTLRETLAGATNSPRTTTFSVTVAAAAPTLAALSLSSSSFTAGAAAGTTIGNITGKTAGSTLGVTPNDGRVSLAGDDAAGWRLVVGLTASSAGTANYTITETLAGASNSPRSTAVSLTITSPSLTLPAGATVIYSLYKVAGSSLPCAQIVRVSDNATLDVAYGADGYMDTAAIDTFLAGGAGRFSIVYDQSGNGNHGTIQGTTQRYSTLSRPHFGFPTINLQSTTRGITLPDTATVNSQAFSAYTVLGPSRTNTSDSFMQMGKTSGVRPCLFCNGNNGLVGYNRGEGGDFGLVTGGLLQARPTSYAIVGSASNLTFHVGATTFARTVLTSTTLTGGYAGGIDVSTNSNTADFMFYALYPNSTVDQAALKAATYSVFGVLTSLTHNFVFPGDSIAAGANSVAGFGYSRVAEKLFNRRVNMICNGIGGQNAADIYANRASAILQAVRSGNTNVLIWQPGTNDIATGTTGANLFANTTVPMVQYALANGYSKVYVLTILPRFNHTAGQETERLAYNQLVRDGAAANNYTVVDFTTDAAFDASPSYTSDANNTAFFADGIHPNNAGYAVMGTKLASVVNLWLPS
jgi:lysophospholipase L1-like esterase/sarcosine oxidase gamma subunit